MRYLKILSLGVMAVLAGCVAPTSLDGSKKDCEYIQRDLTVSWFDRSYWCVPGAKQVSKTERLVEKD